MQSEWKIYKNKFYKYYFFAQNRILLWNDKARTEEIFEKHISDRNQYKEYLKYLNEIIKTYKECVENSIFVIGYM